MIRKLLVLLVLEFLVGVNAGLTFRLVESRYYAALWTGSCFLFLGIGLLYWTYKNLNWRRTPLFWVAFVHTFVFSIPILLTRILSLSDEPLTTVMGIEAPLMHKAASYCFTLLLAATIFEIINQFLIMRAKKPRH
ncbi:MAG: hypothetical protein AABZ31_07670 [Bdellovibrionota bacterium]